MARKTVKVDSMKIVCNEWLKLDTLSQEVKEGICMSMEMILRDSGNYKGFEFLHLKVDENHNANVIPGSFYSRRYL